MRTCPKCGRANDVTRKFCVRCGASLVVAAEETKPKPSAAAIPELGKVTTGASLKRSSPVDVPVGTGESYDAEKPRVATPSEVLHPEIGMAAEVSERTETALPSNETPSVEGVAEGPSKNGEVDYEEGKEVVRQILERVREAETRTKKETSPPSAIPPETGSGISEVEERASPPLPEHRENETRSISRPERVPGSTFQTEARRTAPPVAAPAVSTTADEYLRDEKVRRIDLDIKAFSTERSQLQSDLGRLRARLDSEVERYRSAADAKKARADSITRDLALAKKEWDAANKEYKTAEDHRKKELSTAEKRIEEVDKRSRKAEDAKRKRIEEIEKAKQKLEDESKKT